MSELQTLLGRWLDNSLSAPVRDYKLKRITEAFGLPPGYIATYIERGHAMGYGLQIEIRQWVQVNWDAAPNNPAPDHPLAAVDHNAG